MFCLKKNNNSTSSWTRGRTALQPPEGVRGPHVWRVMLRSRKIPQVHTRRRRLASESHDRQCGTNAYKETMLQQLSQGCAPHTNEGIDRFLHCSLLLSSVNCTDALTVNCYTQTKIHWIITLFLISARNYSNTMLWWSRVLKENDTNLSSRATTVIT